MRSDKKHPYPLAFQEEIVHTAVGMTELKYRGRVVTAEDIVYIRELIAAHPRTSRRRLSQKLCEAWQWKQVQRRIARYGLAWPAADARTCRTIELAAVRLCYTTRWCGASCPNRCSSTLRRSVVPCRHWAGGDPTGAPHAYTLGHVGFWPGRGGAGSLLACSYADAGAGCEQVSGHRTVINLC